MPDDRLWKDVDVKQLLEMWNRMSASQIGAILGRTRSAICGKIGRLRGNGQVIERNVAKHYWLKPDQARPGSKPRGKDANRIKPIARPTVITPPQIEPLVVEPCTIYELNDRRCHWPLGNFTERTTLYCGGATERGIPYCPHHFKRAVARVA